MWHTIYIYFFKRRIRFGTATAAIWGILFFFFFFFFVKRASDTFCVCVWGGGVFSFRARSKVGRCLDIPERLRNTGTDHRNMKKKIPSGNDGGRGIQGFECICSLFL